MAQTTTQITFKGFEKHDLLEADIQEQVARLDRVYDRVTRCHVVAERIARHAADAGRIHLLIEISVPGGSPIVVNHEADLHGDTRALERTAVHHGFDTARRQLEDFARTQRGDVKSHQH